MALSCVSRISGAGQSRDCWNQFPRAITLRPRSSFVFINSSFIEKRCVGHEASVLTRNRFHLIPQRRWPTQGFNKSALFVSFQFFGCDLESSDRRESVLDTEHRNYLSCIREHRVIFLYSLYSFPPSPPIYFLPSRLASTPDSNSDGSGWNLRPETGCNDRFLWFPSFI